MMATPVSPAANSWRGFQELNTRQKYGFRSGWPNGACPRALSRAGQSLRTNIQFRGDKAPVSHVPSAQAGIGEGNGNVRNYRQSETVPHRISDSVDSTGIHIARTCRAWPSADGVPAITVGTRRRLRRLAHVGRPVRFALLGRNAASIRWLSSAWPVRDQHASTYYAIPWGDPRD